SFLEYAYEDKPFPIGSGQTISQPYTVAFQTMLLEIKRGVRILEIGTGSGYQACILAKMGAKVFTIERQKALFTRTAQLLPKIGYPSVKTFFGDGYKGLPAFAPFDRILITAAAPEIPDELILQLKPGGIMVIPLGADTIQTMTVVVKNSDGGYSRSEHGTFRFVPMLKDRQK
ncbi:MAG: protein-L-isoaspartate(D-aspartate) O-methyltransferase, partial [Bacteroidetes bacterium]